MKEVHMTLAVLVYWTIAAVAYGSAECIHGDIRLKNEHATATTRVGGVEVCVSGRWTTVCHTGAWHTPTDMENPDGTANTRVACRQLGYREEESANHFINNVGTDKAFIQSQMCNGDKQRLIECPYRVEERSCRNGARLTCKLVMCDTTIRLRGGSTATEGRVEVCRDGQWGTVCNDSWDRNDASVACGQLGLSDYIAVPVPNDYFGPGSVNIHISNLQCRGNEATLAQCSPSTGHQCFHNQDASVICLTNNNTTPIPVVIETDECASENDTIVYNSEQATVTLCQNQQLTTCNNECQVMTGVSQLGAYFCGSGEITHFLMYGSQLYECPISGAGESLICEPSALTLATNNCQQVLQDIELQASSSSITVTWENADNYSIFAEYKITCLIKNSTLQASVRVDAFTSGVTVNNLPHSTTYECCVTLYIGRYSTRACGNTATLVDTTATASELPSGSISLPPGGGATIALGVLVAVLVLLLVLITGACLYLLIMRVKNNGRNGSSSSTNKPQEHHLENPEYTTRSKPLTPPTPYSTTHPLTPAAPPHTLTSHPLPSKGTELTEFDSTYSAIDAPIQPDLTYDIPGARPAMKTGNTTKKPIKTAPLPARDGSTVEGVGDAEYSALNRPDLVYAVVDQKAQKKKKQVKIAQRYEVPKESPSCQEEYSRLQHGKY